MEMRTTSFKRGKLVYTKMFCLHFTLPKLMEEHMVSHEAVKHAGDIKEAYLQDKVDILDGYAHICHGLYKFSL